MTFFFSLNLVTFLIICWYLHNISNASTDNFDYKIVEKTVITSFFSHVCINISYVISKCSVLVKNAKEQSENTLLYKLKKVLLHFSLTLKFHISKISVCTSDTIAISAVFIKHCHFIAINVVFDISFHALKTS